MLNKLITKVVGSRNERLVKKMSKKVAEITAQESLYEGLTDAQLQAKTAELRKRLADELATVETPAQRTVEAAE